MQHLAEDELIRRLQTIPGIGPILAHVLRAKIGELVERFPSRRQLTSSAGLAPWPTIRRIGTACGTSPRQGRGSPGTV